jgi:hypothetical protein
VTEPTNRVIIDQWIQAIKDTKELTVFPTPRLKTSRWFQIFKDAIVEFNRLSDFHKLGVKLRQTDEPPDTEGLLDGGANVQFDFSGSMPQFRFRGQPRVSNKPFTGTRLEGLTMPVTQGGRVVKAFIFVPMFPLADDTREVGDGVKLLIAVHELVHAASGLANEDHSPESNPDAFCGLPNSNPQLLKGATAAEDRVELRAGQMTNSGFRPPVVAPPINLSGRTVAEIQKRWR